MKKWTPLELQKKLLHWHDHSGRKDLPWQHNKTPYRVWVSEIMLQQTQVSTVMSYFERFMQQFKDLKTLANASEDEVLHLWTGLGYYRRARHLHQTAKIILRDFGGEFPNTVDELIQLPGIGRTTAGAIVAIAFEKKAAILDGNVKRTLSRLHGLRIPLSEKKAMEQLWQWAFDLTPNKRTADYTQAIMDIGATLCIKRKPRCEDCPWGAYCVAKAHRWQDQIPVTNLKKKLRTDAAVFLIFKNNNRILLQQRTQGVWQKLWSVPEIALPNNGVIKWPSTKTIKNFCQKQFNFSISDFAAQPIFRHTFTHFHLDILPIVININVKRNAPILENSQHLWYDLKQPARIGLPKPVKILLEGLS